MSIPIKRSRLGKAATFKGEDTHLLGYKTGIIIVDKVKCLGESFLLNSSMQFKCCSYEFGVVYNTIVADVLCTVDDAKSEN